ncbi:MAG: ATP-binding protein [Bacteroidales bacterium]|nr:ATP-binding protein [Bacteroidales bacterium]
MEYVRQHHRLITKRIEEPRRTIQVLVGPRQVGKSTLMDQVLATCPIPYTLAKADNVNPKDNQWIHRVWESVRAQVRARDEREHLLVIDEIQKIEQWSEAVKMEWDWDSHNATPVKVVLLGSSRLMMESGLKESLAGRFELIRMSHWSYSEMHDAFGFSLEQYLYFGGYPGASQYIDDEARWKRYIKDSIVKPAIEKDVILTSNIYKPALMRQLFTLGCRYSSELLSLTKIMGQLQDAGNVTTLASYINILADSQLLTGLQKYANDESRKYNSVPKFQVYNNALMSAMQRKSFQATLENSEQWGRWVESAVGAHLLSQAEEFDFQVLYWRKRDEEVDYIILHEDGCVAMEVKSGRRKMNSGMFVFENAYHPQHSYIIGTGGIPLSDFLSCHIEDLF